MADENNMDSNTDVTATDAAAVTPQPKKQRAPRQPKRATDMMGGITAEKSPRGRKKRAESAGTAPLSSAEKPAAGKRNAKGVTKGEERKKRTKRGEQPVDMPVAAIDEMTDLIQLEEENRNLRKALAEKLRAENADLRKRLGVG